MKKYEGMFLFDPAATPAWENVQTELTRLMDRAGARVIASAKWDDRRLAYEIRGRKRGVYALTYFEADASKIVDLERDAQLSEAVLRCLIVRADHLTEENMKEAVSRSVEEPVSGDGRDRETPPSAEPKAAPDAEEVIPIALGEEAPEGLALAEAADQPIANQEDDQAHGEPDRVEPLPAADPDELEE